VIVWPAARRGFSARTWIFALLYAATLALFVSANKLTTSANAIFLQSTAPLWVLLLAPLMLGEHVERRDLFLMAAIAVGLWFCFKDAVGEQDPAARQATAPRPLLGNLLALLSGLTWGGTILGLRFLARRSAEKDEGAAASIVLGNLVCFAACVVATRFFGVSFFRGLEAVHLHDVMALLYLGCLQVGLAYVMLARGMRGVPALQASLLLLVEPVFNPIWTFFVHHERPGANALIGGAIILGATAAHAVLKPRSVAAA